MAVSISSRGAVEPFHAMNVLAEANRLRARGVPVISMAVGQPSDPAPERVMRAARAALDSGRMAIPTHSAASICARRSRGTTPSITASLFPRRASR